MTLQDRLDHLWNRLEHMTPEQMRLFLDEAGIHEEIPGQATVREREFISDEVISPTGLTSFFVSVYAEPKGDFRRESQTTTSEIIQSDDEQKITVTVKTGSRLLRAA